MHDARTSLSREVAENVRAFFGPKVYETIIPRNTRVAEAPSHGKPILLYDFDCAGSQAYIKLATEIIERERRNKAAYRRLSEDPRGPMNAPLQKSRLGRGLASLIGEPVPGGTAAAAARGRAAPGGDGRSCGRASSIRARTSATRSWPSSPSRSAPRASCSRSSCARSTGGYEIVAGERRWRAAQKAGLHTVPVIARDLTDKEVLELAIIENVQRADLNAIEEAAGYRELIERFDYSQEQLSEIIGKSRSHVANTLRLLKLPDGVQTMVQDGRLTAGHARALIGRDDAEGLAHASSTRASTCARSRRWCRTAATYGDRQRGITHPARQGSRHQGLREGAFGVLGLKVEIKRGSGESGNLVIKFGNFDQLDYIRQRLGRRLSSAARALDAGARLLHLPDAISPCVR